MTREEFMRLPTLESQFPIVFNASGKWTEFTGYCADCDRKIEKANLRGRVERLHDYRGTSESRFIVAYGFCAYCDRLSSFEYMMHGDMSMEGRNRKGEYCLWPTPKPTRWARFKKWCKSLMT